MTRALFGLHMQLEASLSLPATCIHHWLHLGLQVNRAPMLLAASERRACMSGALQVHIRVTFPHQHAPHLVSVRGQEQLFLQPLVGGAFHAAGTVSTAGRLLHHSSRL